MERLAWIDNLRITVIILVVMLHTAVTYSGIGDWYYKENEEVDKISTLVFAFFQTFTQAYFMSLLFMVSGYFTHKSLVRKGASKFLKERLIRLGIPLLIYIFFIQPVAVKLAYPDLNVAEWYVNGLRNFRFPGWTGPLWFVEALLIFTILYLVIYVVFIRGDFKIRLKITPLNVALLVALITVIAFILRQWYPLGSDFYNLQFGFFSAYVMMFGIGILVYVSGLFEQITLKEGKRWLIVSLGLGIPLWLAVIYLGGPLEGNMSITGGWNWPAFFYALWESFFCVTFIIALAGIYKYQMNLTGKLQKFLSDNAFGVFVFHAPILIFISMFLRDIDLYPLLKFLLAGSITIPLCFIFSFLIRKIPGVRMIIK